MDFDRDAAFVASATLTRENQDAIVRCLDQLECLLGQLVPGASVLLRELNDLRDDPKMLRGVGVRPLIVPVRLDLRIERLRKGVPVAPVERVDGGADDLDVLLRHRPLSIALWALRPGWILSYC